MSFFFLPTAVMGARCASLEHSTICELDQASESDTLVHTLVTNAASSLAGSGALPGRPSLSHPHHPYKLRTPAL